MRPPKTSPGLEASQLPAGRHDPPPSPSGSDTRMVYSNCRCGCHQRMQPNVKAKIGGFALQMPQRVGVAESFGSTVSKMAVSGANTPGTMFPSRGTIKPAFLTPQWLSANWTFTGFVSVPLMLKVGNFRPELTVSRSFGELKLVCSFSRRCRIPRLSRHGRLNLGILQTQSWYIKGTIQYQ